jgi:integrase
MATLTATGIWFKEMRNDLKMMVFEVYGNYVEGLQKDADKILEYFGNDFDS